MRYERTDEFITHVSVAAEDWKAPMLHSGYLWYRGRNAHCAFV